MSEIQNNDVGWSALPEALGRHGRGRCNAGFFLPGPLCAPRSTLL
jgi:hypothetical protein